MFSLFDSKVMKMLLVVIMMMVPATPAATPAPLPTAAFAAPPAASATPPAAPLVAEVSAVLTGQYYFIVIVDSNSIQLVACLFFYRLCIITINLFLFI